MISFPFSRPIPPFLLWLPKIVPPKHWWKLAENLYQPQIKLIDPLKSYLPNIPWTCHVCRGLSGFHGLRKSVSVLGWERYRKTDQQVQVLQRGRTAKWGSSAWSSFLCVMNGFPILMLDYFFSGPRSHHWLPEGTFFLRAKNKGVNEMISLSRWNFINKWTPIRISDWTLQWFQVFIHLFFAGFFRRVLKKKRQFWGGFRIRMQPLSLQELPPWKPGCRWCQSHGVHVFMNLPTFTININQNVGNNIPYVEHMGHKCFNHFFVCQTRRCFQDPTWQTHLQRS